MKRLSLGVVVAAALGFVAGPVSAADTPVKTTPPVVPVLYNWSGYYVGALAQVGHAKTAKRLKQVKRAAIHRRAVKAAKRVKTVKAAASNRAALGLKLVGEQLRMVVFQNRLRGLCEVEKAEQVSADAWRASCADGGAFVIKIYPDGFMTVTRS
jgi:hypothetical protein